LEEGIPAPDHEALAVFHLKTPERARSNGRPDRASRPFEVPQKQRRLSNLPFLIQGTPPVTDPRTLILVLGVLGVLGIATVVAYLLRQRPDSGLNPALVETFWLRIRAWWLLLAVVAATFLIHRTLTIAVFGLISFWALREFITLTPTRPGDHRALFWVFFVVTPLQFVLVGLGWYSWFAVFIPIYTFLLIPARIALADDPKRFLERIAKIQAGLLICVYCFSYAPALLTLPVGNPSGGGGSLRERLLFFFVLMVQLSDLFQYAWSQLPWKHVLAPTISPSRTLEGLLGGVLSTSLAGAALSWATPFPYWLAGLASGLVALMGFAGGLTMSAIKRDRGVQDYGTLLEGHSGVLDRIDSLCFAAPVFFHLSYVWLTG
jgi:phosphatidate cytidylyltransferase